MLKIYLKYIVIIIGINCTSLYSQNIDEDMMSNIKSSIQQKPKILIELDNKNSFISTRQGWILGLKVGFNHEDIFRYGISYHSLYNKKYVIIDQLKPTEENLHFNYLTIFLEYVFNQQKNYEFSLPISFGPGLSWIDNFYQSTHSYTLLYEAELNGMYYFFNFIGLGAGVGYRLNFFKNYNIEEKFTAPMYTIKFKLDFYRLLYAK
ncbi:MAG: hypothetical protein JXR60_02980 [Bacteroidales bacterium]|nr:hypothetical protein [Bacteroidales bacterium]